MSSLLKISPLLIQLQSNFMWIEYFELPQSLPYLASILQYYLATSYTFLLLSKTSKMLHVCETQEVLMHQRLQDGVTTGAVWKG